MRYQEIKNCLDLLKKYKQELVIVEYHFTFHGGRCAVYSCHMIRILVCKLSQILSSVRVLYNIWLHVTRNETIFMVVFLCEWTKITVIKKIHNSCSSGVELASNFVYSHPYECSGLYIPRIVAAKVMNLLSASSKSATVHTLLHFQTLVCNLLQLPKGEKILMYYLLIKIPSDSLSEIKYKECYYTFKSQSNAQPILLIWSLYPRQDDFLLLIMMEVH